MTKLIEAKDLSKSYDGGAQTVDVLCGVDFEMQEGQVVGIYGASGAGKSTLLHILGGLDRPTSGHIRLMGKDLSKLRDTELAKMRNSSVGFVFQFYHLLSEFTALENVMIPCLIAGEKKKNAVERCLNSLELMGLADRANHRPAELSGGEQQRVALARAAVMRPRLILADEPTGNLDRHTGKRVWEYLLNLSRESGIGLIVVSHNQELLGEMSTIYELKDGVLCSFGG